MANLSMDRDFKAKCPRAALAWVIAEVQTGATPEGLHQELLTSEEKILKLAEPKAVLESAAILATRAAYKALGKDPARYRGSAEALLRRVIAGKGLPRVNNVVDVINFSSGARGGDVQRNWEIRFESERLARVVRCGGAAWESDERFGADDGHSGDD